MPARQLDRFGPYLLLGALFVVSVLARPLLPIDETRYLTVSWEMLLQGHVFVPTLNFEPYFQKPPLLFWLIDMAWAIFGPSRPAAMVPVFIASCLAIYLTRRLGKALFPDVEGIAARTSWLMLGSAAFLIYSTLILFDLLLTVFVLASVLSLISFGRGRGLGHAALAGLFVGLGVLTKGPVVLIHLAAPVLFFPLWRNPEHDISPRRFFSGMALVLLVGLAVTAAWLGPAFYRTGMDFAYDLVWRQSAGRIAGNAGNAHPRPFYFYLPLIPVTLLPWLLSVDMWRSKPWALLQQASPSERRMLRFLSLWCVLVVVVFSLIAGKQPHYLVPILPMIAILFGFVMVKVPMGRIRAGAAIMIVLFSVAQVVAAMTVFDRVDLSPIAAMVAKNSSADWASVDHYEGQFTFLARYTKPFAEIAADSTQDWLRAHPEGYIVAKVNRPDALPDVVYSQRADKGYYVVLGNAVPSR